jgi:hypothetical protein
MNIVSLALGQHQAELSVATLNLHNFLETHPGMPDLNRDTWTLSFGTRPGTGDTGRQQRVDEVAAWMGAQAVWRNGTYFAQRDMGHGRLILDAHFTPAATIAEIAGQIRRGEVHS